MASPVRATCTPRPAWRDSAQAAPGDRLTYTLRIQNLSATTAIVNAVKVATEMVDADLVGALASTIRPA